MLVLPIKKKWFDMIASGEKKEEYREFKNYYHSRLLNYFKSKEKSTIEERDIDFIREEKPVIFRNGYNKNSPQIECLCKLGLGYGKQEWGAVQGRLYYILKIIEIIKEDK